MNLSKTRRGIRGFYDTFRLFRAHAQKSQDSLAEEYLGQLDQYVRLLRHQLIRATRLIRELLAEVQRLRKDVLTGAWTRGYFDHTLLAATMRGICGELRPTFRGNYAAIVLLDCARFKIYNDEFGHGVGDLILSRFGHAFLGGIRHTKTGRVGDLLVRWGGDEFVIILRGLVSVRQAGELVARLYYEFNQLEWSDVPGLHVMPPKVDMSVIFLDTNSVQGLGLSFMPPSNSPIGRLMKGTGQDVYFCLGSYAIAKADDILVQRVKRDRPDLHYGVVLEYRDGDLVEKDSHDESALHFPERRQRAR